MCMSSNAIKSGPALPSRLGFVTNVVTLAVWLTGSLAVHAAPSPDSPPAHEPKVTVTKSEPIKPIPLTLKLDAQKVALGRKLFNDPALSRDNTVACASCHSLAKGGTDL